MLKVVLLYLMFSAAIAGALYGIPELKQFGIKHKRRVAASLSLGFIITVVIYFLEIQ